jgi:hypothetical protein
MENEVKLNNEEETLVSGEFCFQFDDDEPVPFVECGKGDGTLTFNVGRGKDSGKIIITDKTGKTFKLFFREKETSLENKEIRVIGSVTANHFNVGGK